MKQHYYFYPDTFTTCTTSELVESFMDIQDIEFEEWSKGYNVFLSSLLSPDGGMKEFKPKADAISWLTPTLRDAFDFLKRDIADEDVEVWSESDMENFYLANCDQDETIDFILDNYHIKNIELYAVSPRDNHFLVTINVF